MQAIQLYIKNDSGAYDRVEMFDDESVSITQSIKNAKDVSKVFTSFTRQFTVPASKINNKIFQHYYNYDIQDGFDARIRKDSKIELNSLPFRSGKLRLDGVDLKDNKPFAYRLTFFGSIVELKDVLGEDKLFSLDALDIDKDYSSTSVRNALVNVADSDGCLVPLITHSQRLYYDSLNPSQQSGNLYYDGTVQGVKFLQLKYAIKLREIIDAIETKYSQITFASDSFFKDYTTYPELDKLYMWCHRNKGEREVEFGSNIQVTFPNDTTNGNFYTSSNRFYVDTQYFTDIEVDFDADSTDFIYNVVIHKNGTQLKKIDGLSGFNTIDVTSDASFGDYFEVFIQTYELDATFTSIQWDFEYREDADPQSPVLQDTIQSDKLTYDNAYTFNIADNLPEQNIIDFLSGLFKMFNLVAYVQDDSTIQVKPLDDFYSTTEHDITEYIDITNSKVDAALPYKEIFFKYKDTKSILADQHLQLSADVEWGGNEYTDTGNLDGSIYKVEPDFHHAKYERLIDASDSSNQTDVQYGYFVSDNEEAYLGKPLIMYVDLTPAGDSISFVNRNSVTEISSITSINMPSNVETIDSNTAKTIHFGEEKNEYTGVLNENSLFDRHYKSYIQNVFNPLTRLVKVTAILPIGKIISIELSDVIVIGGRKYRINSMTSNLSDGKTNFELINYYG